MELEWQRGTDGRMEFGVGRTRRRFCGRATRDTGEGVRRRTSSGNLWTSAGMRKLSDWMKGVRVRISNASLSMSSNTSLSTPYPCLAVWM